MLNMHNKETPSPSSYTETSRWTCNNDMCRPSNWSRFNRERRTRYERLVNYAHAASQSHENVAKSMKSKTVASSKK